MSVNQEFCGSMIRETMNYFIFKYEYFMKISRLYAKFLVNCDMRGVYNPKKFLRNDIKFYRKKAILMDINNCRASLNSPRAL